MGPGYQKAKNTIGPDLKIVFQRFFYPLFCVTINSSQYALKVHSFIFLKLSSWHLSPWYSCCNHLTGDHQWSCMRRPSQIQSSRGTPFTLHCGIRLVKAPLSLPSPDDRTHRRHVQPRNRFAPQRTGARNGPAYDAQRLRCQRRIRLHCTGRHPRFSPTRATKPRGVYPRQRRSVRAPSHG